MTYIGGIDYHLWMAEQIIEDTYGDTVSVASKKKTLLKFGKSVTVGTTKHTIARLGSGEVNESYVTTNAITHFASSSGSDTGSMYVEGHTVSGTGASAVFTFVTQTVTLAGQTKTALTTPLARVSRVVNPTSTSWVGTIYIARDVSFSSGVPGTANAVHMVVPAGEQQSFKCATTISGTDYWIITAVAGSIFEKASGYAEVRLEVREVGSVFKPKFLFGVSSSGGPTTRFEVYPPVIVPKNADVRMTAIADGANTDISAWANGYLAAVV